MDMRSAMWNVVGTNMVELRARRDGVPELQQSHAGRRASMPCEARKCKKESGWIRVVEKEVWFSGVVDGRINSTNCSPRIAIAESDLRFAISPVSGALP